MNLQLLELTALEDILGGYDIYKDCMYLPTEEKFRRKMAGYLDDRAVHIFACLADGRLCGMAVLCRLEEGKAELLGIAVEPSARRKGIGTFMVNELMCRCGLLGLIAETDDDGVGFYRKAGCSIASFTETYGSETVTRYQCVLTK